MTFEFGEQLASVSEPDGTTAMLTLVRRKLALRLMIPEEELTLSIDPHFGFITDSLVMRLKATIYGEELPPHTETRTVRVPATWWDQLKHEKAGAWWMRPIVRRRPVREKPITLTATWENMAAYPWAQLRTQPTPQYLGAAVRLSLGPTSTITGLDDEDGE